MKMLHLVGKCGLVTVALAALMLASSGVSLSQGPAYGGTLKIAIRSEPLGLDPQFVTAVCVDETIYNNVYEGLVKFNGAGEIVMGVAERYDVSEDGLEYTFYLRKGVKFHDDHELTAADVIFTMDRNRERAPHKETYYGSIEEIEALDNNYTVRFKLSYPDSMLIFNFARPDSVILAAGRTDEELKAEPIGTGPFKFVEWVRGDHVRLARFEDYYKEDLPYLDEVIYTFISDPSIQIAALEAGDIDVIGSLGSPADAPGLDANPRLKVVNQTTTGTLIMTINNSREPLNDMRVRRAINYAIDREVINEGAEFGYGTPIASHMSPLNANYIDLAWMYPYDPKKARELLAEAGYPNGFEATIKLPIPYPDAVAAGEIIAQQLKDVGIDLDIEVIEWGVWIDRVYLGFDYDFSIVNHEEAFDIDIYAREDYYFYGGNLDLINSWLQEVIRKAKAAVDLDEQKRLYAIAQWIIASDATTACLLIAPGLVAMKDEVMNWWPDRAVPVVDVSEVWLAR